MKLEAIRKFEATGLKNVKVETAHSIAYKQIVFRNGYKVRPQGYRTNEIVALLHLRSHGEKHSDHILANHIGKLVMMFCNSNLQNIYDVKYLETIADIRAKAFVKMHYRYIKDKSDLLLKRMDKGEVEITHDFYLKKFQLSAPQLKYDYILFDEAQDASPAMLDVFLRQRATKVIVGDTHQQIYGWRNAVNSLEKANFPVYHLTQSFRFGPDIARLAMQKLKFKKHLFKPNDVAIQGKGNSKVIRSRAVIARSNLALLLKAIEYVTKENPVNHIYFEGNINSYTYADDGASLYDVLNLHNGKRAMIRDSLIRSMKDMSELEVYIDTTEDVQLGMMVDIVNEYGNEIPSIIKMIKQKHVSDDEKLKAEIIFSTVHRSKGMEYDSVELANDFVTEKKLEKMKESERKQFADKLNEEINLLYVAVTRTKSKIYIPEELLPQAFMPLPDIHVLKAMTPEVSPAFIEIKKSGKGSRYRKDVKVDHGRGHAFEVREDLHGAYRPWTEMLNLELVRLHSEGMTISGLAKHFARSEGSVRSRLKKLEMTVR